MTVATDENSQPYHGIGRGPVDKRVPVRDRVNARIRRLGLPEIPEPEPATKENRAAARIRRLGVVPVADRQPTNQQRNRP